MTLALLAAVGVSIALLSFLFVLVQWEVTGRAGRTVALILGIALFEALSQRSGTKVPLGLWRIPIGVFDARPVDVLLPIALAARGLARPLSTYVTRVTIMWVTLAMWYLVGAYWGYSRGNDLGRLINETRGMLLVVGFLVLLGGVRLTREGLERLHDVLAWVSVAVVAFVYGFRFTVGSIRLGVPLIEADEFGRLSPEASLILVCLGMFVVLGNLLGDTRRGHGIFAGLLLVLSPLLYSQAASMLAMAAAIGGLLLVSYTPRFRSQVRLTGTEVVLFIVMTAGIALLGQVVLGLEPEVVEGVEQALFSDSQSRTSGIRVILWSDARQYVSESPLMGQGVGFLLDIPQDFPQPPRKATSHNIFVDLVLRTGVPGLLLLLGALTMTMSAGWRQWARLSGVEAGAALAALISVLAVVAKGMAESSIDQFRQATLLGIAIGIIVSFERDSHGEHRSPAGTHQFGVLEPAAGR